MKIDFKTENNQKLLKAIEAIINRENKLKLSKLRSLLSSEYCDMSKRLLFNYVKELKNQDKAYWVYNYNDFNEREQVIILKR